MKKYYKIYRMTLNYENKSVRENVEIYTDNIKTKKKELICDAKSILLQYEEVPYDEYIKNKIK